MNVDGCESFLRDLFGSTADIPGEFGVTCRHAGDVTRIGFATNLTPDVVAAAGENGIDLLVTHHDAWDFVYGMKERCLGMLSSRGISHLFAHLPLDAADFGTGDALSRALGGETGEPFAPYEGQLCGRISTLPEAIGFDAFVERVQDVCGERVQSWRNSERMVQRIGIVPGAGPDTAYVKECVERDCDLYLTGEKSLYTVQYARFAGIHLVVGSHTFTEIFGVESLVERITREFPETEAMRLPEAHLEAVPLSLPGECPPDRRDEEATGEVELTPIALADMVDQEYERYIEKVIPEYAAAGGQATGTPPDEALVRARTQIEGLLHAGPRTPGQYLKSITAASGESVGVLWFAMDPDTAPGRVFIYDIFIDEAHRGRGLGSAAMQLLEEDASRLGAEEVALHVFSDNTGAIRLYERRGYEVIHDGDGGMQMTKRLRSS
jgi:putative NIF3 family GTP cyclohydrolase 1 type 2/ribosomal protein S18 acetylase RimI-like enzyme